MEQAEVNLAKYWREAGAYLQMGCSSSHGILRVATSFKGKAFLDRELTKFLGHAVCKCWSLSVQPSLKQSDVAHLPTIKLPGDQWAEFIVHSFKFLQPFLPELMDLLAPLKVLCSAAYDDSVETATLLCMAGYALLANYPHLAFQLSLWACLKEGLWEEEVPICRPSSSAVLTETQTACLSATAMCAKQWIHV